ncbi:MAG TPA: hypothetical protein VG276_20020 [Actinomycetes bacterium]|jgi:hypothetical protein|nr:hypothetical protein [Actinomycetes bacterium]
MFIQVIQGRASSPDGIRAELDRWNAELQPGAEGWLGSTSGVTDDGRFIAVVRFASEDQARRNSDRPEQGAWWTEMAKHLAEVAFHDSTRVHTYRGGGSDEAGFVQVIQGHTEQMERLAELGRAQEVVLAEQAPHILGMTVAEHADRPGDFTQTVYFTSEEDARRSERERPAESEPEIFSLMADLRYFDVREPWLDSPK